MNTSPAHPTRRGLGRTTRLAVGLVAASLLTGVTAVPAAAGTDGDVLLAASGRDDSARSVRDRLTRPDRPPHKVRTSERGDRTASESNAVVVRTLPALITDDFDRADGNKLTYTSSANAAWKLLRGGWATAGNEAVSSTAPGSDPLAVVDGWQSDVKLAADLGAGGDALVLRATDAGNWLRVRTERDLHDVTETESYRHSYNYNHTHSSNHVHRSDHTHYTNHVHTSNHRHTENHVHRTNHVHEEKHDHMYKEWHDRNHWHATGGRIVKTHPHKHCTSSHYHRPGVALHCHAYKTHYHGQKSEGFNHVHPKETYHEHWYGHMHYKNHTHYSNHTHSSNHVHSSNHTHASNHVHSSDHTHYSNHVHTATETRQRNVTREVDARRLVVEKSVNGKVTELASRAVTGDVGRVEITAVGDRIRVETSSGVRLTVRERFNADATLHGIGLAASPTRTAGIDDLRLEPIEWKPRSRR